MNFPGANHAEQARTVEKAALPRARMKMIAQLRNEGLDRICRNIRKCGGALLSEINFSFIPL
jgi:hypothetical protein